MEPDEKPVHITGKAASGGSKQGVVRWVLIGGLLLAIALLSITWIIPAMTQQGIDEGDRTVADANSKDDLGKDQEPIINSVPEENDNPLTIEN